MSIRNEILRLLESKKVPFRHLVHTSTDSRSISQEISVRIEEGIKCLILRGKKSQKNILVCLLGHHKLDMSLLAGILQESCELEKPAVIKERFGLEIGGIPPFGALLGLDMYFDTHISSCKEVAFSSGLAIETIAMALDDLLPLVQPKTASFAKNLSQ